MRELVDAIDVVNLVAFTALAGVALRRWWRRRDRVAGWIALCFAAIAVVAIAGQAVPEHPHDLAVKIVQRLDVAVLLLFPYLLYRFTTTFRSSAPRLVHALTAMTGTLIVWTFALPRFPAPGDPRPDWFVAYLAGFLVDWTVVSVVSAWRLYDAGKREPNVARRRMHMLALAVAAITIAIFLAAATRESHSALALAAGVIALVSALAFLLGLAPPAIVRLSWRRAEQARLQQAIADLITLATTREEIATRVLPPMADIVGARAVALRDADGNVIGAHNVSARTAGAVAGGVRDGEVVEVEVPGGSIVVWTTPYAPFFGNEEFTLLRTLGALTSLALDRVGLFAREREARLALERADELKTRFVALAAHELRTPVTTIHGFVQTLNRLRGRISAEQEAELRESLEAETERMASLVEQLLDLSRLDAEAIEIEPERIRVREHVEQVVATAAGARSDAVEIRVPAELISHLDRNVVERVLSNLITNALRYGAPPVIVSAEHSDRHFRLTVEDRGGGVPREFVPDLFERFARSAESRRRADVGTGLGLAIARAYARAHSGDLLYEDAVPTGARFQLVIPTTRPEAAG